MQGIPREVYTGTCNLIILFRELLLVGFIRNFIIGKSRHLGLLCSTLITVYKNDILNSPLLQWCCLDKEFPGGRFYNLVFATPTPMCKTILTLNLLNYSVCRSVHIELTSCLHYYNNFIHIRDIVKINFRLNTSLVLMFFRNIL